jgi:hypothetical protein
MLDGSVVIYIFFVDDQDVVEEVAEVSGEDVGEDFYFAGEV